MVARTLPRGINSRRSELAGRIAINPNTIAKAFRSWNGGITETLRGGGALSQRSKARHHRGEEKKNEEMLEKVLVEAYYADEEDEVGDGGRSSASGTGEEGSDEPVSD